jgi:DNA replicative helicase MCM subunit Mcm2 (Cdc46/Mcm family)
MYLRDHPLFGVYFMSEGERQDRDVGGERTQRWVDRLWPLRDHLRLDPMHSTVQLSHSEMCSLLAAPGQPELDFAVELQSSLAMDAIRSVELALHAVLEKHARNVILEHASGDEDADEPAAVTAAVSAISSLSLRAGGRVILRLVGHRDFALIRDLRANRVGTFVSIRGTIVRAGSPRPLCARMLFRCPACEMECIAEFPDGAYTPPAACPTPECRNTRAFEPQLSSPMTVAADWQRIKVQELTDDRADVAGGVPRSVDVDARADLVGVFAPGDMVVVSGVLRAESEAEGGARRRGGNAGAGGGATSQSLNLLYVDAVSIENLSSGRSHTNGDGDSEQSRRGEQRRARSAISEEENQLEMLRLHAQAAAQDFDAGLVRQVEVDAAHAAVTEAMSRLAQLRSEFADLLDEDGEGQDSSTSASSVPSTAPRPGSSSGQAAMNIVEFTMGEMYGIREMVNHTDPFALLCASLAPAIRGNDMVKAGIVLSLLGGSMHGDSSGESSKVRGEVHILVCGDPGLGKSQILTAVSRVSPRGVYVCGSYASSSGLTVSFSREKGSNEWALDAGALVLADMGVCCVDEFDKMKSEHGALLEAMEQGTVSVAKAGIVCSLPARASVIAAANPVGGNYSFARTLAENLNMKDALLSRFDLIFVLVDSHDADRDAMLTAHVMGRSDVVGGGGHVADVPPLAAAGDAHAHAAQPLLARLKRTYEAFQRDPVPPKLLRKYIAYARKYVNPRVTPEAAAILKEWYMQLRRENVAFDATPVTVRQLEAAVRLAEARAKAEMAEEVTVEHARDVVEILRATFRDVNLDPALRAEDPGAARARKRAKTGTRRVSAARQADLLLARLHREVRASGVNKFSTADVRALATALRLPVVESDSKFERFVAQLNEGGKLLMNGGGWKVT